MALCFLVRPQDNSPPLNSHQVASTFAEDPEVTANEMTLALLEMLHCYQRVKRIDRHRLLPKTDVLDYAQYLLGITRHIAPPPEEGPAA